MSTTVFQVSKYARPGHSGCVHAHRVSSGWAEVFSETEGDAPGITEGIGVRTDVNDLIIHEPIVGLTLANVVYFHWPDRDVAGQSYIQTATYRHGKTVIGKFVAGLLKTTG